MTKKFTPPPPAPKLPALMEPFWIEVAVPDPVTGDRALIHTAPFTAAGVLEVITRLQSLTNWQIDEVKKQLAERRANP